MADILGAKTVKAQTFADVVKGILKECNSALDIGAFNVDTLNVWQKTFGKVVCATANKNGIEKNKADNTTFIEGLAGQPETEKAIKAFFGTDQVDFLFIYAGNVTSTMKQYYSLVRSGGVVAFQDSEGQTRYVDVQAKMESGELVGEPLKVEKFVSGKTTVLYAVKA